MAQVEREKATLRARIAQVKRENIELQKWKEEQE